MNRRSVVLIVSVVILAVFAAAAFFYSPSQSPQQAQAPGSTAQETATQPNQYGGLLVRFH